MAEVIKYEYEPHVFMPKRFKRLPFLVCHRCGLVSLKNTLTKWCIGKGCNYDDHPGYQKLIGAK